MNSPSSTSISSIGRGSIGAGILIAIGLSAVLLSIDYEMMKPVITGEAAFVHQAGWMLACLVAASFATAFALGKYRRVRTRRSFIVTMMVLWILIVLAAVAWLWIVIGAGMPSG
jgi:hypothetical protein